MMNVCFIIFAFNIFVPYSKPYSSVYGNSIPKTSTNPKHPGKPWFNDECKDAIKNRKKVVRKTSNIGEPWQFPYLQGESS
jgi:hypothetical protein